MNRMTKQEKKTAQVLMISHFFSPLGPLLLPFLYYFAVKRPGTKLLFFSAITNVLSAIISVLYTVTFALALYDTEEISPYLILMVAPAMLILGVGFQALLLRMNLKMRRTNMDRQQRAILQPIKSYEL